MLLDKQNQFSADTGDSPTALVYAGLRFLL